MREVVRAPSVGKAIVELPGEPPRLADAQCQGLMVRCIPGGGPHDRHYPAPYEDCPLSYEDDGVDYTFSKDNTDARRAAEPGACCYAVMMSFGNDC